MTEPNQIEQLGQQLLGILTDAATKFIRQNSSDVAALGNDVVNAILTQAVFQRMPAIAILPVGATAAQRAELEELLLVRDHAWQLVAQAEREAAARVNALQGKAITFVEGLGASIFSALISVGIAKLSVL